MSKLQYEHGQMMGMKSFLICTILISIILALYGSISNIIEAQETQGGSSSRALSSSSISSSGIKGAAGFSSFRQNLASIQEPKQQKQRFEKQEEQVIQRIQQPIQPSTVQILNIVNSTSTYQRPIVASQQVTSTTNQVVEEQREDAIQQVAQTDSEPAVYGSVDGVPGIDFPGYKSIPNTPFSCYGSQFDPGMYADEFTGCQSYHLCYQGRRESFLCGIGTVFNQATMNCDFWHAVDCSKSSKYYYLNLGFGRASAESGGQIGSNFAKQEVSNQFLSNQIQVQPIPVLSGKTSFVRKQQFSTNQLVAPQQNWLTSSSFSRVKNSQSMAPQVLNGKNSFKKEEQFLRSSQNTLSPVRQLQINQRDSISNSNVNQNFIETNQQSSESSNQINAVNGNKQQTFGKTSIIFDNQRRSVPFFGFKGSADEILKSEDENDVWKPYFRSKPSPNNPTPTSTPSSLKPTSNMVTSDLVSSTISLPDEEPSFSGFSSSNTNKVKLSKVPKGSAPYETSTMKADENDAGSKIDIEPDVSPALTVTPSTPEALTTEMNSFSSSSLMTTMSDTPVETTAQKASSEEATTVSGSGDAQKNNSSRFIASLSGVEYENEPLDRNETQSSS